jgi:ATP-dependent helicase/nuclease subunit B
VVVPTRQSGRRLREALAVASSGAGGLLAPQVSTPDALLVASAPAAVAGRGLTLMAWVEVLRAEAGRFPHLLPVVPSPEDATLEWALGLAARFERVRAALGDAGLTVSEASGRLPEPARWGDFARLERRVVETLGRRGLADAVVARLGRSGDPEPPPGVVRVIVAGVPEMAPAVESRLAAMTGRVPVEVWVGAPESEAGGFSPWGRPLPGAWAARQIDIPEPDRRVHLAADPPGQARAVCAALRARPGARDRAVTVASVDPDVSGAVLEELRAAGVALFDPEGDPLSRGMLHPCLAALAGLLGSGRWGHLRELLRQPLAADALGRGLAGGPAGAPPPAWPVVLAAVERFYDAHLPQTFDDLRRAAALPAGQGGGGAADAGTPVVPALVAGVGRWLDTFRRQPFAGAVAETLRALAGAPADEAGPALALADELGGFAGDGGGHPPADLLALLVRLLGELRRYPEPEGAAGDLLGWLELLWDDAPDLVVAGFNDGRVPEAVAGDAFLPERACELLGLRTNPDRAARDAYLLESLLRQRRAAGGTIDIVLGKTGSDGSPLKPSRLLFLCPDPELPGRARRLFGPATAGGAGVVPGWSAAWRLMPPAPLRPHRDVFDRLRVTDFGSYLACPFRFYLRRGLVMDQPDPDKDELDARDFGTVVHAALERVLLEPGAAACTDGDALIDILDRALGAAATSRYGRRPPVLVRLQLEVAKERLRRAARVQAAAAASGWSVVAVEHKIAGGDGAPWSIDGVRVTGTVDRIERHEDGRVRVLDYKTSQKPKHPREAHLVFAKKGRAPRGGTLPDWRRADTPDGASAWWTNLQLPLYCLWAAEAFPDATGLACGYFQLPAALDEVGIVEWDGGGEAGLVGSARRCAGEVARRVRGGEFWPPAARPEFDEFEALAPWGPLGEALDGAAWRAAFAEAAGTRASPVEGAGA